MTRSIGFNRQSNQWEDLGAHGGSTYGFWNECLAVDPTNSDVVLSGGTSLERSSDAGESWTDVALDSDHHAVTFSSSNSMIAYVGNDHGVRKGILLVARDRELGKGSQRPDPYPLQRSRFVRHRTERHRRRRARQRHASNRWRPHVGPVERAMADLYLQTPTIRSPMCYVESYALGNPDNGDVYRTTDGGANTVQADTSGFQGPFVTPMVIESG